MILAGWSIPVGQNGAFGFLSWAKAIAGWHREIQNFTFGVEYSETTAVKWYDVAHFTQVCVYFL